jgi:ketosteroid isomerase-like protein
MPDRAAEAVAASFDEAMLDKYQAAWSKHDPDAIIEMMTEDCVYDASFGPEPWGERFVGREAVREGILRNLAASDHPYTELTHYERHLFGDYGFSMWTSMYRNADGTPVSLHGCDFYEFRDGLVAKKIAFRKAASQ